MDRLHKLRYPLLCLLGGCALLLGACGAANEPPAGALDKPDPPPEHLADEQDNRLVILRGDQNDAARNRLLAEDVRYLAEALPAHHLNPFDHLSQAEFTAQIEDLAARVDTLSNNQVFTELARILAQIKDAHTGINYWNGYVYALEFALIDDALYIVNADPAYEEALYCEVLAIDGRPTAEVLTALESLISHENEQWLKYQQAQYLALPVHLDGLGLLADAAQTVFQLRDTLGLHGEPEAAYALTIPVLNYFEDAYGWAVTHAPQGELLALRYLADEDYYWYAYDEARAALYFRYNVCAEMAELPFATFNESLFAELARHDARKVIVDLRDNTGGDSSVFEPFAARLAAYRADHPGLEVYALIGRATFSSGIFAVYHLLAAAPDLVLVGEPTGGAPDSYGYVHELYLPHSRLPVNYSVCYFALAGDGRRTYEPDVWLTPRLEDYDENFDRVLDYVLDI